MPKFSRPQSLLCAALALAAFTAACSNIEPTAAPSRSFTPLAAMSRDVTPIAGRHIFVMNSAIPADFAARVNAKGGTIITSFDQVRTVVTSGLSDADAAALAVGGVVANDVTAQWVPLPTEMSVSATGFDGVASESPTTPLKALLLANQWNMLQIHAPEAWAAGKLGTPTTKVAILDTGIDPDHQELRGLVDLTNSARVVATQTGCAFNTSPAAWADDFFHGTFVSGQVTTNNLIMAGVAPNVRLVAVKVLGSNGSGSFSDIICGLQYAALFVHPQVINMSLGALFKGNTPGLVPFQQFFAQFIDFAKSQGAVVVAAAGNDDKNLGLPHPFMSLPCEAGSEMCVSATSNRDMIARYSNFGRAAIDVAAPGGEDKHLSKTGGQAELLAEMILGPCSGKSPVCPGSRSGYVFADGTSASAPHVAGLAALIASQHPTMSPDAIMALIRSSADNIGNQSKFGDGRINVARALGVQ
jgi:subtilisin family serine protease